MMCRFNVGMCYSHVNINQQTWAEAWIKTNPIGSFRSSNVACDNWKHTTLVRTLQASMTKFQYCKHRLLINVCIKKKKKNILINHVFTKNKELIYMNYFCCVSCYERFGGDRNLLISWLNLDTWLITWLKYFVNCVWKINKILTDLERHEGK